MSAEELREALGALEAEVRRRAILELPSFAEDVVLDMLPVALGDEDWRVRKEAVAVARALCSQVHLVPMLIEAVSQGDNVGLRNAAVDVLGGLDEASVEELLAALDRVPAAGMKFVVAALGRLGGPRLVPTLSELAGSPDANLSAAAMDALAVVGGADAELALRARLKAADPYRRMAALDSLDRLEAVVPSEELAPFIEDRLLRGVALRVLGRSGTAQAIEPLLRTITDSSRHVAASAVVALSRLARSGDELKARVVQVAPSAGEDARAVLRDLLVSGDVVTRAAAAHLLSLVRDAAALGGIVRLSTDGLLSEPVAVALGSWGVAAVDPLLDVHRTSEGARRAAALEMAADLATASRDELPGRQAAALREVLRQALGASGPGVVLAAARSMVHWAQPEDAARLVQLATREDERLAQACGDALIALAGRDGPAVQRALAGVPAEGAALTRVSARVGGEGAVERLRAALCVDEPATRRAAVEGLAAIGGESAAQSIIYALADEDVDVQTAAAHALGQMRDASGHPLGTQQLILTLSSETDALRAAAARALGASGERSSVPALRGLLDAGAPGVALAAIEGLRSLGDPALSDPDRFDLLVGALGHDDAEVVKQALMAVAELGGPRSLPRLALGLEHPAWDVRRLAATLLSDVPGTDAREALVQHRRSETDDLVLAAIDAALRRRPEAC